MTTSARSSFAICIIKSCAVALLARLICSTFNLAGAPHACCITSGKRTTVWRFRHWSCWSVAPRDCASLVFR
uniref:Putative secreted peptide n=1 Tax=Anopheles braziliensis TaxID=58242 RepID=A0A2M3ZVC9_9DIPT